MPDELRLAVAFVLAALVALAAVPVAIRLAWRTAMLDHPVGYKQHTGATPYLGGLAVAAGLGAGLLLLAGPGIDDVLPISGCALALLVVGTIDDRIQLGIVPRLIAESACAVILFRADLGLQPFGSEVVNFGLTLAFVLGVVNAYNLMDNLDGAAATVAGITAAGLGSLAAFDGSIALGVMGLALAGACAGFLRYNLARPAARIFLGDGGSMSIGIVISGLIMALPPAPGLEVGAVAVALLLVGLPALDTALVIVSRRRRGVSMVRGGRDHLTHRLLLRLGTPREVALTLAAGQAGLIACAAIVRELDEAVAVAVAVGVVAIALAVIAALELPRRLPATVAESAEVS